MKKLEQKTIPARVQALWDGHLARPIVLSLKALWDGHLARPMVL
jgi:hypothetical protein